MVLAPGGSARSRLTFTVPDGEHLAGASRPFAIRVTGGTPAELVGRVDVAEVRDVRLSISPMVARARGATTHTVTVENRGTATGRAELLASEPTGRFTLRLASEGVSVAPGEQAKVEVTVIPRRRLLAGRSQPHPFTVEARTEGGPPITASATRFLDPVRWRRGAAVAALTVALASVVALVGAGRGPAPDQIAAPVVAQQPVLGPACAPKSASNPVVLDIAAFAYCPATLTVAAGTEVVWTNADLAAHTVTYEGQDGTVDSGSMAQGQSWSTRFAQAGTYRYYCRFHPGMAGTIVVDSGR
jgi:plastocyanin